VSVSTTATQSERQLVQRNELDPELELLWTGSRAGDGSAGTALITMNVPVGKAIMWVTGGASVEAADKNFRWTIALGAGADPVLLQWGCEGFNIDGDSFSLEFSPRYCIMIAQAEIGIRVFTDNPGVGKDLVANGLAYAWDLQHARNLPFKFMWPGTLS